MWAMLMKVTFSESELASIDRARGHEPRATFVRRSVLGLIGAQVSPGAEMVQDARDLGVDLKLGTEIEPPKRERSPRPRREIEQPREETELPKIARRHWA